MKEEEDQEGIDMSHDQKSLEGMTVNERIYEIGKTEYFDHLILKKDVVGLCFLLMEVFVEESDARKILHSLELI